MLIPGLHLEGDVDALPWRETAYPGVAWIPLHTERREPADGEPERRGGATVLIRMEPGCSYPPHRHRGIEQLLVLRGAYRDYLGRHERGEFVHYPAGSAHAPVAEPDGTCILFAVAPEGIELLGRESAR